MWQSLMVINAIFFASLALVTMPIFSLVSLLDGNGLRTHLLAPEMRAALDEAGSQVILCAPASGPRWPRCVPCSGHGYKRAHPVSHAPRCAGPRLHAHVGAVCSWRNMSLISCVAVCRQNPRVSARRPWRLARASPCPAPACRSRAPGQRCRSRSSPSAEAHLPTSVDQGTVHHVATAGYA